LTSTQTWVFARQHPRLRRDQRVKGDDGRDDDDED
jgi:hypothetical protein